MKKNLVFLLVVLPVLLGAQVDFDLRCVASTNLSDSPVRKGDTLSILGAVSPNYSSMLQLKALTSDGKSASLSFSSVHNMEPIFNTPRDYWLWVAIQDHVYPKFSGNNQRRIFRQLIQKETAHYLSRLVEEDLLFHHLELELYLNRLLQQVLSEPLDSWRQERLNVKLLKSRTPELRIYPNGLCLINTGLLSAVKTEKELLAILAVKVAHYVLEHATIRAERSLEVTPRRTFWNDMTDLKNTLPYTEQSIQLYGQSLVTLARSPAHRIKDRWGFIFNRRVQKEADGYALLFLQEQGIEEGVLPAAFLHIQDGWDKILHFENRHHRENSAQLSWKARAKVLDIDSRQQQDTAYAQLMAPVHAFNAALAYHQNHTTHFFELLQANVQYDLLSSEDCRLLALASLKKGGAEGTEQARKWIEKGLNLDASAFELHKLQALLALQEGQPAALQKALNDYQTGLKAYAKEQPALLGLDAQRTACYQRELFWVKQHLSRLSRSAN